ncbi:MAG: M48 family metalloprotease [Pseudomonadota bacterium]
MTSSPVPARLTVRMAPLVLGLGLALSACAPASNTGPSAGALSGGGTGPVAPPSQAIQVREVSAQRKGDAYHPQVVERFGGVYDEGRVDDYVRRIGQRLVAVSAEPGERWTFTVLDSPVVNAFAVPGGYIYVTRGLVALANDEAELAGVIGHEIAHVTARHGAQRETRQTAAGIGVLLGTVGLAALGIEPPVVSDILGAAVGGTLASYSREDEREADRIGIRLLADAGYDPQAQADFLASLARNAALDAELAGGRYDPEVTGFFATHPATAGRTREARAVAAATGVAAGERARERHLTAIDGMAWGPSAAQGFVRDGAFLHPDLDFRFSVPQNWAVINRPSAVLLGNQEGDRVIFDAVKDAPQNPEAFLRERWAPTIARSMRTGPLRQVASFRIDGQPAARGVMPVEINDRPYIALLIAIRRPDRTYRFTGLMPQGGGGVGRVASVAESFARLSLAERQSARQRQVVLRRVQSGDTVSSLAGAMDVERGPAERFEVLNGLNNGALPPAGTLVKLVR